MSKTTSKELTLFVKSAIRKAVNQKGCNVSKDVISGNVLNNQINKILDLAIANAKKHKRKTLMAKDFKGLVPTP